MTLVQAKNAVTKAAKEHAAGGEIVTLEDGTNVFTTDSIQVP
jgi:hypothetical protein